MPLQRSAPQWCLICHGYRQWHGAYPATGGWGGGGLGLCCVTGPPHNGLCTRMSGTCVTYVTCVTCATMTWRGGGGGGLGCVVFGGRRTMLRVLPWHGAGGRGRGRVIGKCAATRFVTWVSSLVSSPLHPQLQGLWWTTTHFVRSSAFCKGCLTFKGPVPVCRGKGSQKGMACTPRDPKCGRFLFHFP